MYSLATFFFIVPLYFSHLLEPLGYSIGDGYSFERQKIYLFYLFIVFSYIEGCIRFPDRIITTIQKYGYTFLTLALLPILSTEYYTGKLDTDFLVGSHEKHHGYLFFIGILMYILLSVSSPLSHLKKYLNWSIAGTCFVALIAIGEYIGGWTDIFHHSMLNTRYSGRSLSTLGNPNYLAGYLLLFVPILFDKIAKIKWNNRKNGINLYLYVFLLLIFLGAIYTTKSYVAYALLLLFLLWQGISFILTGYRFWIKIGLVITIISLALLFGSLYLDPMKLLSLESRFVIMHELINVILQNPLSFLTGFGIESIPLYFSEIRSLQINNYFPSGEIIDSSHNLFIDIIYVYGLFPIIILVEILYSNRKRLKTPYMTGFLLLMAFLGLNVYILLHILLGVLLVSISVKEKNH